MTAVNLLEIATTQLAQAQQADSGRHSQTVYGGRENELRQTLICLIEGHELNEHDSPGEATVQVLVGAIDITTNDAVTRLAPGDFYVIAPTRHSVMAASDAAFLLTVATRGRG